MSRILLLLLMNLSANLMIAQTSSHAINFELRFGEKPLILNQYYKFGLKDSVEINTLKFYISSVELLLDSSVVWQQKKSFHLIDAAEKNSQLILLEIDSCLNYNRVKFNVGIDSLTNTNGVMGDDLDPTRNMYWTWQSGYINVKLEGHSSLSGERKNEFKFHLGGYQFPFNSLQTIFLKCEPKALHAVHIDLLKVLSDKDWSESNYIMSPGYAAIKMSEIFVSSISIIN